MSIFNSKNLLWLPLTTCWLFIAQTSLSQPCPSPPTHAQVSIPSGPSSVCINTPATYTVDVIKYDDIYCYYSTALDCQDITFKFYLNGQLDGTYATNSQKQATHTWSQPGVGRIEVEARNCGVPPFTVRIRQGSRSLDNIVVSPQNPIFGLKPTLFCKNQTQTVSILPYSGATSFTFEVPNGWKINGANVTSLTTTSTSVNITAGTIEGNYTYRVRANATSCGNSNWTQASTWVGAPIPINFQLSPNVLCLSGNNYVEASHLGGNPAISDWDWQVPVDWQIGFPDFPDKRVAFIIPSGTSGGYIQLKAANACSSTAWYSIYVSVQNCGFYSFVIGPNPSTDYFDISVENENTETEATTATHDLHLEVHVLDQNGQVVKKKEFPNYKEVNRVSTDGLIQGIYYVHILFNGRKTIKRISIN